MSYLLKSSSVDDRRKTARKKILLIIGIIIIILLILSTGPVRQLLFSVASPIWKIENSILNSKLGQYFKFKQTLIDEKTALQQKLFLAGNLLAENEILQTENDNLKDLLGRKDLKLKTILATVLVKPPQTPFDMLIVDAGLAQTVSVGDKVIANANTFIGEVIEVQADTAKISLYSTPGRKLSVVLGTNSVTAEAVGVGGGNFNIKLPKEVEVKEGDVIVIPSITTNVFGIVEKVNSNDNDSFQMILFKSPVNISELNFVEIVLSKK